MNELKAKEYKLFEEIRRVNDNGREYWLARKFAPVLEYTKWSNFSKVIDKARIAAENSVRNPHDDFADVGKIVTAGAMTKKSKVTDCPNMRAT